MKRMLCSAAILLPVFAPAAAVPGQAPSGDRASGNDQKRADYFRVPAGERAGRCRPDIPSPEDWQARRGEYRRQLEEMLGLWPMPERTDLKPVITGKLEQAEFTVEKLHFQAMPRLYVTAISPHAPAVIGRDQLPHFLIAMPKTNLIHRRGRCIEGHHEGRDSVDAEEDGKSVV